MNVFFVMRNTIICNYKLKSLKVKSASLVVHGLKYVLEEYVIVFIFVLHINQFLDVYISKGLNYQCIKKKYSFAARLSTLNRLIHVLC